MTAPASRDLVVHLVYAAGQYTSAECQFGAHHACPGGTRKGLDAGGGIVPLRCQCTTEACSCRHRRQAAVQHDTRTQIEHAP